MEFYAVIALIVIGSLIFLMAVLILIFQLLKKKPKPKNRIYNQVSPEMEEILKGWAIVET